MPKNSTTPKAAPARERHVQDSAAVIARYISAILNHPGTPVCIYDALADAVCDLYLPKSYTASVAYLTPILAENLKRGDES